MNLHQIRVASTVTARALAATMLVAALTTAVRADIVYYKGNSLKTAGEVIRDMVDEPYIWLRWKENKPGAAWTTSRIDRSRILRIETQPGDQSDGKRTPPAGSSSTSATAKEADASSEPAPELKSPRDLAPLLRKTLPPPSTPPEILILKLEGGFKFDNAFEIGSTITPGSFNALMDVALERKPAAIVLAINSKGGLVAVMKDVIERTLEAQKVHGMRVVAWPREAGSAAAILSLSCREIVASPMTRMGAATQIDGNTGERSEGPSNALEQKLKAWEDSLWTLVSECTGRPSDVQRAMQLPEQTLRFHPTLGFGEAKGKANDAGGWVTLDSSEDSPCVLTGEQLMQIRFASGMAKTETDLAALLKLPATTPIRVLDLNHPTVQAPAAKLQEQILREYQAAAGAKDRLMKALDRAISKADAAMASYAALPEWVSPAQIRELREAAGDARASIPSIAKKDRPVVEEWVDEAWLSNFDFHTNEARGLYGVITQSLDQLKRNGGKFPDSLSDKLLRAHNHLVDAYNGPKQDEP